MTTQWHPLFAKLLRPVVESHYDVQINVPVGDVPREADILLLRRRSQGSLPFRGLWKHLTTWTVLEFKGPTVSPRLRHLDLLVEVGLGIDRRLNEEQARQHLPALGPEEVSFWYVVNRLGKRFLRDVPRLLGPLEPCGNGLWRCSVLGRLVYLVSSAQLPVEEDSLPLHVLAQAPPAVEMAVVDFIMKQPTLWRLYGPVLTGLHRATWREVEAMAKSARKELKWDLEPWVEYLGMDQVIRLLGRQRVLEELGQKRVLEALGPKKVLEEMGLDWLLSGLTPAQRRQLKQRLQERPT
jgi:hypothetical protein